MYTVKWDEFRYSSRQFGLWRIAFGLYLTYYYLGLLPYGAELFSREGFLVDFVASPGSYFPEFILHWDSAQQVRTILLLCISSSILITLGYFRRTASFLLWLLAMWLFNRNPLTNSPEYAFINWLIFCCIFIPIGEAYSLEKKDFQWTMPRYFYWGAWIILVVGYGYAGSTKFKAMDKNWLNGTAMYYVLVTDNARMLWYGNFFDSIPKLLFIPISWGALCSQTFAPVFASFRRMRPWWWLTATAVHFSLLFFVNLAQVSLGMLLFHFFIFDLKWLNSIQVRLDRSHLSRDSSRLNARSRYRWPFSSTADLIRPRIS